MPGLSAILVGTTGVPERRGNVTSTGAFARSSLFRLRFHGPHIVDRGGRVARSLARRFGDWTRRICGQTPLLSLVTIVT